MRTVRRRCHARTRGEDGAISVLTAALLAALVAASSLAVDVGRVAYVSRDQQGVTERAALDGVDVLIHQTGNLGDTYAAVLAEVEASLARNGAAHGVAGGYEAEQVRLGRLDADGQFVHIPVTATTPPFPEAVEVRTRSRVDYVFTLAGGGRDIGRVSVASIDEPIAAFSTATTTAGLHGGALDTLVAELLGGEVDLDAVGWQGLADATVDLGLLAAELPVGTVDALVAPGTTVAVDDLLEASAAALTADAPEAVRADLERIAALAVSLPAVEIGEMLQLDAGSARAGAEAAVDAFSLVVASLQLANRGNLVDLPVSVAGVGDARLRVIEPPVIAVGPVGTVATSAQTELEVDLQLTAALLGPALEVVTDLVESLTLGLVSVSVIPDPVLLRITTAAGAAELTGVTCRPARGMQLALAADTATVSLPPTDVIDVRVLGVPLGTIRLAGAPVVGSASGTVEIVETEATPLPSDPYAVTGSAPGLAGLLGPAGGGLTVETTVAGLDLSTVTGSLLDEVATGVLAPLDAALTPVLSALGVHLGETEVRGLDVAGCDGRRLIRGDRRYAPEAPGSP